jgi:biopolymer transport protein ExbB
MSQFMHLLPILVAAAFALAIIVERAHALYVRYPVRNASQFFDRITDLVMAGKLAEAVAVCDKLEHKPSARVVKLALLRAHQPETLIESGLELEVGKAAESIEKRTQFLAMIANVATLLGLFGTIAGLITSFAAIGQADAAQKSQLLATGISQAMNATMLGLGVAIPCMVAFSFLMNRTNRLVAEVDHSAVQTLDILRQRFYSAQVGALKSVNGKKKAQESL